MGANFEKRPQPGRATIDPADVHTGEFLAVSKIRGRWGGFEALEKWGTGAFVDTAVCLKYDMGICGLVNLDARMKRHEKCMLISLRIDEPDSISDNYPPPLDARLVVSLMSMWTRLQPAHAANMWNEALNKQLGTEIRDAYTLKIFESNLNRLPSWCDTEGGRIPFCQILGEHRMELPEYNTIDTYTDMNENCPSLPPTYDRPGGC